MTLSERYNILYGIWLQNIYRKTSIKRPRRLLEQMPSTPRRLFKTGVY